MLAEGVWQRTLEIYKAKRENLQRQILKHSLQLTFPYHMLKFPALLQYNLVGQLNIAYKRLRKHWKLNGIRLGYCSKLSFQAPQERDPQKKIVRAVLVHQWPPEINKNIWSSLFSIKKLFLFTQELQL